MQTPAPAPSAGEKASVQTGKEDRPKGNDSEIPLRPDHSRPASDAERVCTGKFSDDCPVHPRPHIHEQYAALRAELEEANKAVDFLTVRVKPLTEKILVLEAELREKTEALMLADSYFSLLWHRHIDTRTIDAQLALEVTQALGKVRSALKSTYIAALNGGGR